MKLSPKRKYEIWLMFLENVKPNVWFPFVNTGEQKEEIIQAFKELHDHFGLVQFSSDYTKYMRLDPLTIVREIVGGFNKTGAEKLYLEEKRKIDDFYTKAYNPENMEAQKKEWEARNAETMARRALRGAQTNDLSKDDPDYTQGNPSSSSGLKSNENDGEIKKDHDQTEETEY